MARPPPAHPLPGAPPPPPGPPPAGGVLPWLTSLTCAVLAARFDPSCGEEDELHTMAELLLEVWCC